MKLKIEFTRSRSEDFDRVLALIRKIPSYKEITERGISLYSIEFDESNLDSAQAVMDMVRGWKKVAFYMDGRLVPRFKIVTYVWDRVYADFERTRKEAQKRRDVDGSLRLRKSIREAKSPKDLINP